MLVGGGVIHAKFPMKNFLNLESRENGADDTVVSLTINPASISFPPSKTVTNWVPIKQQFKELGISGGATIRWEERHILTRYRFRPNMDGEGLCKPVLLVEAIILKEGTWEAVPETKKKLLSRNQSSALRLWGQDCQLYSSMPDKRLPTIPGILRRSAEAPLPGEFKLRWYTQAVLRRADSGKSVDIKEEFEAYMALDLPYATYTRDSTFHLPYPYGSLEKELQLPSSPQPATGRKDVSRPISFKRNGKVIKRVCKSGFPTPSLPQKFNTLEKGCNLSMSVLPPDAPNHLRTLACKLFNASIAMTTAKSYMTAASHIARLEADLGRKFSWPLSSSDSNLLLAFLLSKGVKANTVKTYLSGARRMAIARGVQSPAPQTELAKCILQGYQNLERDPVRDAAEATHRPVTIPFLRLLGHAANKFWKGHTLDRLCFWTVCLAAFWGSLRLGEVLCPNKGSFAPGSALLGTDVIHMSKGSFALWIRDPKVSKKYGDVVEIWETPQFLDLNPFSTFSSYWNSRKKLLLSLPLFLMADGKNMTRRFFDSAFHSLLSRYSMELELSTNRWTGHSFRSGLPTLLQSLGFSEDDIKAWGRWASAAFQLYARDVAKRYEVQRSILSMMDRIRAHTEG